MLDFLYHDKYIVVCVKPVGILSEPMAREKNLPDMLQKQTGAYKIDVIHRLDRNVGGVMVYSKSRKATEILAKMMAAHKFEKEYLAVVEGKLPQSGTFEDYLVKDRKNCKVYVGKQRDHDAKYAKLTYEVLAEKKGLSLVRVHQIRVQFASRGCPLVGDTKYGRQDTKDNGKTPIALFSFRLAFEHPVTRQPIEGFALPQMKGVFSLFREQLSTLKPKND